MSKVINFTATEVLPALLNKTKCSTIRKAWEETNILECPECGCKDIVMPTIKEKPARFKVGDKATPMWNQRSKSKEFCFHCGEARFLPQCHCQCGEWKQFEKVLGEVEITEVFKITMRTRNDQSALTIVRYEIYWMDGETKCNWPWGDIEDMAHKDGFKSTEDMFAYFDKAYDLSSPKTFHVYRWRWL